MKEIDSETCDLVIDRKDYNNMNNVLQNSINNLAASKFKEVKTNIYEICHLILSVEAAPQCLIYLM